MMNRSSDYVLAITGGIKTCTSSMVGLLNSHPEIFILYEAVLGDDTLSPRSREFLSRYPDARSMFYGTSDFSAPYEDLRRYLGTRGHHYRVIGTKKPTLDLALLEQLRNVPTIYCYRDVRTWLAKDQVRTWYMTDVDIVPAAVRYCVHLIGSMRLEDCLHVPMKDFVEDHERTVERIGDFLGLTFRDHSKQWWSRGAGEDALDPKAAIDWQPAHPSSAAAPSRLDMSVVLAEHPFWDDFLPIFDRYSSLAAAGATRVDSATMNDDLALLSDLRAKYTVSMADGYRSSQLLKVTPTSGNRAGRASDKLKATARKGLLAVGLDVRLTR